MISGYKQDVSVQNLEVTDSVTINSDSKLAVLPEGTATIKNIKVQTCLRDEDGNPKYDQDDTNSFCIELFEFFKI